MGWLFGDLFEGIFGFDHSFYDRFEDCLWEGVWCCLKRNFVGALGRRCHTAKDAKERRNLEMREKEPKEEISQAADLVAQVAAEN